MYFISYFSVVDKIEDTEQEDMPKLPRVEVIRRLRERLEPIILFGETEFEALKRLRSLEINEPDRIEGIKNDYIEAMDKVEKEQDQEIAQGSSGVSSKDRADSDLYETSLVYDEIIDMIVHAHKGDFIF